MRQKHQVFEFQESESFGTIGRTHKGNYSKPIITVDNEDDDDGPPGLEEAEEFEKGSHGNKFGILPSSSSFSSAVPHLMQPALKENIEKFIRPAILSRKTTGNVNPSLQDSLQIDSNSINHRASEANNSPFGQQTTQPRNSMINAGQSQSTPPLSKINQYHISSQGIWKKQESTSGRGGGNSTVKEETQLLNSKPSDKSEQLSSAADSVPEIRLKKVAVIDMQHLSSQNNNTGSGSANNRQHDGQNGSDEVEGLDKKFTEEIPNNPTNADRSTRLDEKPYSEIYGYIDKINQSIVISNNRIDSIPELQKAQRMIENQIEEFNKAIEVQKQMKAGQDGDRLTMKKDFSAVNEKKTEEPLQYQLLNSKKETLKFMKDNEQLIKQSNQQSMICTKMGKTLVDFHYIIQIELNKLKHYSKTLPTKEEIDYKEKMEALECQLTLEIEKRIKLEAELGKRIVDFQMLFTDAQEAKMIIRVQLLQIREEKERLRIQSEDYKKFMLQQQTTFNTTNVVQAKEGTATDNEFKKAEKPGPNSNHIANVFKNKIATAKIHQAREDENTAAHKRGAFGGRGNDILTAQHQIDHPALANVNAIAVMNKTPQNFGTSMLPQNEDGEDSFFADRKHEPEEEFQSVVEEVQQPVHPYTKSTIMISGNLSPVNPFQQNILSQPSQNLQFHPTLTRNPSHPPLQSPREELPLVTSFEQQVQRTAQQNAVLPIMPSLQKIPSSQFGVSGLHFLQQPAQAQQQLQQPALQSQMSFSNQSASQLAVKGKTNNSSSSSKFPHETSFTDDNSKKQKTNFTSLFDFNIVVSDDSNQTSTRPAVISNQQQARNVSPFMSRNTPTRTTINQHAGFQYLNVNYSQNQNTNHASGTHQNPLKNMISSIQKDQKALLRDISQNQCNQTRSQSQTQQLQPQQQLSQHLQPQQRQPQRQQQQQSSSFSASKRQTSTSSSRNQKSPATLKKSFH